ncbi:MAG TPA: carboxypeptidase regulatory-like domain-containing protein [Gemmataceae bacterium]|nr:carboxypeptidase regulatory-like domain-containing protein [Gemmataceae bacterium]
MTSTRASGFLLIAVLMAGLAGCGPKTRSVSGKVTYKAEPADFATVTLLGTNGRSYGSQTGTDGTFTIANVPDGEYTVTILSFTSANPSGDRMKGRRADPKVKDDDKRMLEQMKGGMSGGSVGTPSKNVVPAKYGDPSTSDLKWNTKAEATKNFDLS